MERPDLQAELLKSFLDERLQQEKHRVPRRRSQRNLVSRFAAFLQRSASSLRNRPALPPTINLAADEERVLSD